MTTDQNRAAALTGQQRKAINDAARVLADNWEFGTADDLLQAFAAPTTKQPEATPIQRNDHVCHDGEDCHACDAERAPTPPKRAVQFRLELQADTVDHLVAALTDLATHICAGRLSAHAISGGVFSSHECWLVVADHPTHVEYIELLEHWRGRITKARGGNA